MSLSDRYIEAKWERARYIEGKARFALPRPRRSKSEKNTPRLGPWFQPITLSSSLSAHSLPASFLLLFFASLALPDAVPPGLNEGQQSQVRGHRN